MAQSNSKTTRWIGMRNSHGTNVFRGAPAANIVAYDPFRNISPDTLLKIAENLGVNNIIRMYNYLRPSFDAVAKTALKNVLEKNPEAEIRIHIGWNEDTFYRVLELLDTYVHNIIIIGPSDETIIGSDIDRMADLFARCNIQHLRFEGFSIITEQNRKKMTIVRRLYRLRKICMLHCNRFVDILQFPITITEFRGRVSATDSPGCPWCGRFDISQNDFNSFLKSNRTLRSVTLRLIRRYCGKRNECKEAVTKFILNLKLDIAGRGMTKFDVEFGSTTHSLV